MKVHTIIGDSVKNLEKQVNQYLSSCDENVVQVNYCAVPIGQVFLNTDKSAIGTMNVEYSAMIVIKD